MYRRISLVLATFLSLSSVSGLLRAAQAPAAELSPEVAKEYIRAHDLIDVGGGRKIHLHCRGKGAVTVIFDSGLSDWSSSWALIQPQVAESARACTYDRAGMGYSDAATRPSTPFNVVDDLRHLIKAAGIKGPVVLVGHSLGGFNMKLFAASYPSEVAGLVLVDPSEERMEARTGEQVKRKFGAATYTKMFADDGSAAQWISHFDTCAEASKIQNLDASTDFYKKCTDPLHMPLGSVINRERHVLQVRYAYQAAQASEARQCVYGDNPQFDEHYARLFAAEAPLGNMPLIVLTHSIVDKENPLGEEEQFALVAAHQLSTALSKRGTHRIIPNTHHNIQVDDPASVVQAVNELLNTLAHKS